MPPPVLLAGTRLLEYASADETVAYTDKSLLYVDGKLLGRVPHLAICESLEDPEIFLLYCDEHWALLGLAGFDTIEEARRRAESEYHGITDKWIDAKVSKEDVERYVAELYRNERCSFCGRKPLEIRSMVSSSTARICDQCITSFFHDLQEHDKEAT